MNRPTKLLFDVLANAKYTKNPCLQHMRHEVFTSSNEFSFNLYNTEVDNNLTSSTLDTVHRPSSRPAVSSRDAVMGG